MSLVQTPGYEVDMVKVLQTLGLNKNDPKAQTLLIVCEKYQLDPLLKHVQIIQGSTYVTRDGYLTIAHASGQFDGMEIVEEGETDEFVYVKVAVHRKDMKFPFTATGRADKKKRNASGPDDVDMALARAERRALRRAFNVSGVGTGDIDNDNTLDTATPNDYIEARAAISAGSPSDRANDASVGAPADPGTEANKSVSVPPAELLSDYYNENRVSALAAMSDIGVKSEEDRHAFVLEATKGRTESTKQLEDIEVDAIRDLAKRRGDLFDEAPPPTEPEPEETGELAGSDELDPLRDRVALLDDESAKGALKHGWKASFGSLKTGRVPVSALRDIRMALDYAESIQDEAWLKRQKASNAAMGRIGISGDKARHEFISEATNGETESTAQLTSVQLSAVLDSVKQYEEMDANGGEQEAMDV